MVHKDNPEKFQYDWNDIKCHGGADLETLCMATGAELAKVRSEIFAFIRGNDIQELCELVDYCIDEGMNEWLNVICNKNTLIIQGYLRSRRLIAVKPVASADT
ncbi:MAG: replication protein [Oscillospiraceae bacterium]|jgi:hypothetical protein|nr:replication protein [Oscillospiraceae bacterium]